MYSHREIKTYDDYLRHVCQAIEKYDTQELLAYLAHSKWSVITDKERVDIEKESTKELKLLMLRKIIGLDKTRIRHLQDVLKSFAHSVHSEVMEALSCEMNGSGDPPKGRRYTTKTVDSKSNSEAEVLSLKMQQDKLRKCEQYCESHKNEFHLKPLREHDRSCFVNKEERPEQTKKPMDLHQEERMWYLSTGNTKSSRSCAEPAINSRSDLMGSQILPVSHQVALHVH